MHKSDNESENEKKELIDKAIQAHAQFLKALDALWEADHKLCIITYSILNIALTAMMRSRAEVVRHDEIEGRSCPWRTEEDAGI